MDYVDGTPSLLFIRLCFGGQSAQNDSLYMLLWVVVLRLKGPAAHGLSTGAHGGAAAFGTAAAQVMEREKEWKGKERRGRSG